jgi:hypothetical protein
LSIYFEPAKVQKSGLIACRYWKMLCLGRWKLLGSSLKDGDG